MIAPKFTVSQDPTYFTVVIFAPSGKLDDVDISYFESQFLFSCAPYYLRLHIPGEVLPYESEKDPNDVVKFDFDFNVVTVHMRKKNQGEEFVGLEDLEQLMNPVTNAENVVELEGGVFDADGVAQPEFMRQELAGEEAEETPEAVLKFGYGFNFKRHGVLGRFREELKELFDISYEIEESPIDERTELCLRLDIAAFDPQYFLAEYFDTPDMMAESLRFETPKMELDDDDIKELDKIRKKKIAVYSDMELRHVLLSLIDIVFAYVYDNKVNTGDSTCESAWTYTKLAPTFSCLARYETALEAFTTAMRRSLCYGLYRHFDFAKRCAVDTASIIQNDGIEGIIHILLKLRKSLASEVQYRYLLNDLFIDDYIRYLRDVLEPKDYQWLPLEVSYVVKRIDLKSMCLDLEELIAKGGLAVELGDVKEALDSDDDEEEVEQV